MIRAEPRVSVVAEAPPGADTRCIIVQGRVRFLDSAEERRTMGEAFIARYGERLEARWGGRAVPASRVLWRVDPTRVKHWG